MKSIEPLRKEEVKIEEELFQQGDKKLDEFLEKNAIDLEKKLFSLEEGDRPWQEVFDLINQDESLGDLKPYVLNSLNRRYKKIFQKGVLETKKRPDGRGLKYIRTIYAEIDVLPRTHGSAIFMRGLTHILSVVTLAEPGEELWLRDIEFEGTKRFIHHYNFPPFSTGEIGSSKKPSRREIGHGELAEKALRNLIPPQETFPYTIRVVSEVLSSNGSTSMGSVCASSLALMSAGVPIKTHAAGISIGMAYESDENYELLTDIQGPEDFFGAMDFKIAGTEKGLTAIQLDVKIEGLNLKQIKESLERAKEARSYLLNFMKGIIEKPKEISLYAPKIEIIKIDPLKIGLIIGTGGRTINEIIAATNVKIDIHPDGTIYIIGDKNSNFELAKNWIKSIADAFNLGEVVKGKVIKILPFGAVLELAPNRTALLHISEIADRKIEKIEEEVKIGDELLVKIKNISEDGKIYVSLKDVRK
jgi:polyribonucleotide nucleotidyltransferase